MIQWPDLNLPPINLWSLPQWRQDQMKYDHTELKPKSINDATPEEWNNVANNKKYEFGEKPKKTDMRKSPLDMQVFGNHYKNMAIQPVEFIQKNNLPFIEGSIIKYVCRHKSKDGKQDLEKAKHFIELLIELEYGNVPE